jgi:uncharacterized membrane protein YedE/YeeE
MKVLGGLIAGLLFGGGLALAGMTDPAIVLGFLDIAGAWNPALLAVMALAVPVTLVGYRLLRRMKAPLFDQRFAWANTTEIDTRLLGGAALFGIGWGLSGYCPGPAIASLSSGETGVYVFLVAVAVGSVVTRRLAPGRGPALADA